MAGNPFFSIVIPTRNRPQLFLDALKSALLQNFHSFEVIVSDNSTNDETEKIIEPYLENNKLKFVKPTSDLNMLDHWEFASRHARGQIVLVLTDRSVLCQGALKKMEYYAKKYPEINCFSVGTKSYCEDNQKFNLRSTLGPTKIYNTNDLISNFKNKIFNSFESLDYYFPKSINSFYRNEYVKTIRAKNGFYFNTPGVTTPDYSSFFINCFENTKILNVKGTFMLGQGSTVSNGSNFSKGDTSYLKTLGERGELLQDLPLVYNAIYNDFVKVYTRFGDEVTPIQNLEMFYKNLYFEIFQREQFYQDPKNLQMERKIDNSLIIIGLNNEKVDLLKNEARLILSKNSDKKNSKFNNWKIHLNDFLYHRFGQSSVLNTLYQYCYNSVLEAAGFKETFVNKE